MADRKKQHESALTSMPKTDVRLSPSQIRMMLIHVIRMPSLFTIAKNQMPAKVFTKEEIVFRKLWEAALEIEKKMKSDFFYSPETAMSSVWGYLEPRLSDDPEIPSTIKDELISGTGLINDTFERKHFDESQAHALLKRFLRERLVQQPLWKKLSHAEGNLLIDLPDILREARELDTSLTAIDHDPVESGAPEGWTPVKLGKFKTNITFLDTFLRGGHAPGEVYGILGAFASGKTSLAVQLLYRGALWQQQNANTLNQAEPVDSGIVHYPKECYIFTYEATKDEIRVRLWSSACTIHHEVLEEFNWDNLSTIEKGYESLKQYEKKFFENLKKIGMKEKVQGERERLESMLPLLRRNLWILDMTGTDNPKQGTGYVSEIRQIIDADLLRKQRQSGRKHEVGLVVIDYAGLAASKYMNEHNIPDTEMRFYVGRFGNHCKKDLAVPLNCPVWVFHQLTGEANKRTYKVQQHYTDAAESKSFAENLAFCFALGTKDDDGKLLLTCSKARRARTGNPPTLVLEGEFFRLAESRHHMYDPKTRNFVPRQDLQGEDQNSEVPNSSSEPIPMVKTRERFAPLTHTGPTNEMPLEDQTAVFRS